MGSYKVYYVPDDQDGWVARFPELVTRLVAAGIPVSHEVAEQERDAYRARGAPLPECPLDLDFDSADVERHPDLLPVPNQIWEANCPSCGHDVVEELYEVWGASDDETAIPDRLVTCPTCRKGTPARELRYGEPIAFARVVISFGGIEPDDWPPELASIIEDAVGPLRVFHEWTT